jgi:hypothetical protein
MKRPLLFVTLVASLMLFATPANAQSFGVRAGASANPDQFFFGGHYETRPLMEHLTFRPNIEVGFGDDTTLVAFNIEFAYWIDLRNKPWKVYLGGGPAANLYDSDNNTDLQGGFNLMVGAQHRGGLFGEFKVGLIDSPDVKFTVGYAFK